MSRPQPYHDDPPARNFDVDTGWYWRDFEDRIQGPYVSRRSAVEAIDKYMFNQGLLEDGSLP